MNDMADGAHVKPDDNGGVRHGVPQDAHQVLDLARLKEVTAVVDSPRHRTGFLEKMGNPALKIRAERATLRPG